MVAWTIEVRVPSAGGAWTLITPNRGIRFGKDLNQVQDFRVALPQLSAAEELLVIEGNDIRALAGGTERWYGQISKVDEDPYLNTWDVLAFGKEIKAHDRAWATRREWVNIPPEVIADEVLGNVMDEELRAGQVYWSDLEALNPDGTLKDLSGNDNAGTFTGTSSVVGKWSLARRFVRASSEQVLIADSAELKGMSELTVTGWLYLDTIEVEQAMVDKFSHPDSRPHYLLGHLGTPGRVSWFVGDGATANSITAPASDALSAGQWYHLAGVYEAGARQELYIDGVLSVEDTTPPSFSIGTNAQDLYLGRVYSSYLNGRIDQVQIYDRALSLAQIRALAGRSIYEGGLLADAFDPISFRAEEDARLNIIDSLAKTIGAEWFSDRDGDDRDRFRLVARRGSASPTDTFQLGVTVLPPGPKRVLDRATIVNDVIALGYGDAVNQLRSRIWHGSTVRQDLAVKLLAADTVIDVGDASSYPADGVVFAGMERIRYTGKTASTLTGLTHAYTADGYESLDAYDHSKGISVWLHVDTSTTPDTTYDPSNPQTGSSIADNTHKQGPPKSDRGIIDQDTLDFLAQRLLATYKDPRDSLWLKAQEEDITADVGDDVTVLDLAGGALFASPYRLFALEFEREAAVWDLELGSPRDAAEAELARIREELRLTRSYGQGSVTGYHTQMAENIEGGQRDMLMDLTISDLAKGVNRVVIERLRLRAFEKYTGSGGTAHGHNITGQATEDESLHTHGIPATEVDFVQVEEVRSNVSATSIPTDTWSELQQSGVLGIELTAAAKYVHAICHSAAFTAGLLADDVNYRVRREPVSWASLRAFWPMDHVVQGNATVLDLFAANHLTRVGTTVVTGPRPATGGPDTGGARDFNGTTDELHKTSPSFINDNIGTVAIWVKTDQLTSSRVLWSVTEDGTVGDEFYLTFLGSSSNQLRIVRVLNGFDAIRLDSPSNAINDTTDWHLVILTSDGSTLRLYVDDVEQTLSVNLGSNDGSWFVDAADADVFTLGGLRRASFVSAWDGQEDEVYVFNRVWTSAERTKMYDDTVSRYFPSGEGIPDASGAPNGWRVDTFGTIPEQNEFGFTIKCPADTDGRYWLDAFYDLQGGFGAVNLSGSITLVSFKDTFPAVTSDAGSAHQHPITGQATDTETAHTHDSDLVEDPYVTPSVGIKIDGTDRTAALGGPWAVDQSDIDISEFVSATGLHTLEFFENSAGKVGRVHASVYVEIFLRGSR